MAGNWIKDLVDEKKARDAKARALALLALGGANPTEEELGAFTPGRPIESMRGTTGASPTTDPAGATADLQAQLRNEELARAAATSAPAVQALRQSQALADAGLNETALNQAEVQRLQRPAVAAKAALEQTQAEALHQVLVNPDVDPLLRADLAAGKAAFRPQLVKVQRKDGTSVYMNQTPTLSGQPTYTPALDEDGNPLTVPVVAARGGGAGGETALQKNTRFLARVLFAGETDAEKKAAEMLTTLKSKSPVEAWDSLTRFTAKMDYGRYAKNPQRLFEKTAELWRVARPMEPIPRDAPEAPLPGAAPAPAPAPTPAAPRPAAAPAPTAEPTAINPQTGERLVFRNGRWQPLK